MSELINNRQQRQRFLKELITDIHQGKDPDEVKKRFQTFIKSVGPTELSQIEQSLIEEGLPVEEVQRLCDVHVSVFRESLEEQVKEQIDSPAHPVNIFRAENEAIESLVDDITRLLDSFVQQGTDKALPDTYIKSWNELHLKLLEIENHYSRKENLLFPFLEKNGITGPPSVMWSIHDEIRAGLKNISRFLENPQRNNIQIDAILNEAKATLQAIKEMVFKENQILLPMCQETLTEDEWGKIAKESPSIGFALINPKDLTMPQDRQYVPLGEENTGYLKLDTGVMSLEEINAMLKSLPIDITFVDRNDTVKYFSESKDRIFQRTKAIIGRKVQHCHPPASVHVVNKIVEDFKSGKRDVAEFWIQMKEKFVYIRYFAVRDDKGNYLGTAEVTQDIRQIRSLQGEKRILDEKV
jgi:DUF438 domain-containing protein